MASVFTDGSQGKLSIGNGGSLNVTTHFMADDNGEGVSMNSAAIQRATTPRSKPRISAAKNEDARGRMAHFLSEAMQNERFLVVNRDNLDDSVGPLGGTSVAIKVYMEIGKEMVPMIVSIYSDAKTEQVCQAAMDEADANFQKDQEILMALDTQEVERNRSTDSDTP
jgi:hypothetical protein